MSHVQNFRLSFIHGTRNKGLGQVKLATNHLCLDLDIQNDFKGEGGQEGLEQKVSVCEYGTQESTMRDPRQVLMKFEKGWA